MSMRGLVQVVMFLVPLAWLAWNLLRSRKWGLGLVFFAAASMFFGMALLMLFGSGRQSQVLSRNDGRLAYIDSHQSVFFERQPEPLLIPEGGRAYLEETSVTLLRAKDGRRIKQSSSPFTAWRVMLGTAGQSYEMDLLSDRARAQAKVEELNEFVRGDAPRMVLYESSSDGIWVMLFFGLLSYGMGLGAIGLGVMTIRPEPEPEKSWTPRWEQRWKQKKQPRTRKKKKRPGN
jgi:hypothetical protein